MYYKINAISKKVDKIAETGMETSREVRGFIERTIAQVEQVSKSILTFDAAKKLAMTIIDMLNKNKKNRTAKK
jgi:leucyl-tRNA synthetase